MRLTGEPLEFSDFRPRCRFVYLSMFFVQLSVVLFRSGEVFLGLHEFGFSDLDLLILPGHLQEGLHLAGAEKRSEVSGCLHSCSDFLLLIVNNK